MSTTVKCSLQLTDHCLYTAGHEEVMRMAAEILGCPITGPWSLELDGKDGRIMGRQ